MIDEAHIFTARVLRLLHAGGMLAIMSDVTRILAAIEHGDPHAAEQLLPLVYDELRKLAARKLALEKPGQTLQATALVHEAYVRLVGGAQTRDWNNRGHFFAAAAEAMRRILIDQARHKASEKAGGNHRRVELAHIEPAISGPGLDMLALNEALEQLEKTDPRGATVVKLRFFAGMTMPQVAEALGVSLATAENDWAYAKCCLRLQLADAESSSSD
jgi:RNA polymerase sigma factor (TIGR02999 family)